jgi:hypothetical protein
VGHTSFCNRRSMRIVIPEMEHRQVIMKGPANPVMPTSVSQEYSAVYNKRVSTVQCITGVQCSA